MGGGGGCSSGDLTNRGYLIVGAFRIYKFDFACYALGSYICVGSFIVIMMVVARWLRGRPQLMGCCIALAFELVSRGKK